MSAPPDPSTVEHRFVNANGVRLHVACSGSGPLIVMLHGFPELWYSFRYQMAELARSHRVVAPDLRGYGESERPAAGYDLGTLALDVRELIASLGASEAVVCGHDWGGAVAWRVASRYPEVVRRLIILNCPHPALFRKALRRRPGQILRSSYMFFFQIPWLPERLLRIHRAALLAYILRRSYSRPGALAAADLEVYRAAWLKPGALEAALAYYRTMFRRLFVGARQAERGRITAPTLLLWGEKDWALGRGLTEGTERYVDGDFLRVFIPSAGHFVHQDAPEEVNRAIRDFLRTAG